MIAFIEPPECELWHTMKFAFAGTILALCGSAQTTLPELGVVSGTVTSSTGQPLRRALVQLAPTAPIAADPPAATVTVETDFQGVFTFEQVARGRYFLTAERSGYLHASFSDGRSGMLTISPGQKVSGIALKMIPQGILGGRVIDEDGEPVAGVGVSVSPYFAPVSERGRPFMPLNGGLTNADGAFAIGNLSPGKYLIAVNPPATTSPPQREPGRPLEIYVTTHYPDTVDIASAAPIELRPGEQARGLEIRLRRVPVFRISGRVVNTVTSEPASAVLNLFPRGSTPGLSMHSAGVTAGDFSFEEIPPGSYILEAKSGSEPPLLSWQVLSVGSGDLDRVVVEMKPGIELTGNVIVEGSRPALWPQITLTPEEGLNHPTDFAMVDENGRFAITGLEPAPYRVSIGRPSGPMFVKSVRFSGREVSNEVIDLASARTVSLEIVISDRVSKLDGTVTDTHGPVGAGIFVIAMSKTRGDMRTVMTDDSGRFSFSALPPGDFLVAAIDTGNRSVRPAPEVLSKQGREVTVAEGASASVDLPLIALDAVLVDLR
jgi:hypothetical protein